MKNTSKISSKENLARFIFSRQEYRQSDFVVKPRAFMPPASLKFSVTCHAQLEDEIIWQRGYEVADQRKQSLKGRTDLLAEHVRLNKLDVELAPVPNNPEHANIIGWPPSKESQQLIALLLAQSASKVFQPPE